MWNKDRTMDTQSCVAEWRVTEMQKWPGVWVCGRDGLAGEKGKGDDWRSSLDFSYVKLHLIPLHIINNLATWCKEPTHWERSWCWERLRAGRDRGDRGWDGWMASPNQWTRVWANFGREWRTGKPGVLQSMGLQRAGYDLVAEQQQHIIKYKFQMDQP